MLRNLYDYQMTKCLSRALLTICFTVGCLPIVGLYAGETAKETTEESFKQSNGLVGYTLTYLSEDGKELSFEAYLETVKGGVPASFEESTDRGELKGVFRILSATEVAAREAMSNLAVDVGGDMPSLDLPDLGGRLRNYADFGGRPVLLSFYFSQCIPCINEVPLLNELAQRDDRIGVLAVTFDTVDQAEAFSAKHGFTWPIVPNALKYADRVGVKAYPTQLLVSATGELMAKRSGAVVSASDTEVPIGGLDDWLNNALSSD